MRKLLQLGALALVCAAAALAQTKLSGGATVFPKPDNSDSLPICWLDTTGHQLCFLSPTTLTSSTTWRWPSSDGSAGYVLTTDGAGNLSWATAGSGSGISYPPAGIPCSTGSAWCASYHPGNAPNDLAQFDSSGNLTMAGNLLSSGSYNIGSTTQFFSDVYSVQFTGKVLQITSLTPFVYSYYLEQDASNVLYLDDSNVGTSSSQKMVSWTPQPTGATMTVYGNVVPDITDAESLGVSGDEWNALYVHNLNITGTCTGCQASDMMTTDTAQTVTGTKTFSVNLLASGSFNIGSTSQFWANAYSVQFTGKILQLTSLTPFVFSYFLQEDGSDNLLLQNSNISQPKMVLWTPTSTGATMTVYGNVVPDATDSESLGISGDEWNALYVKNLNISGTCTGCSTAYTAGTGISITSNVIANTGVVSWDGSTGAITDGVTTDTAQTITADKTVNANILGGGGFAIGSTSQFWSNIYGSQLYTKTLQVTSATPFVFSYFLQEDGSNNLLLQDTNVGTQPKMVLWTPNLTGATMTVYGNVMPNATDSDNLGGSGQEWNTVYAKNLILSGSCTGCGGGGGGMTWPSGTTAGLAYYSGANAWGTTIVVGNGANDIPQLDSSANLTLAGSLFLASNNTYTLGTAGDAAAGVYAYGFDVIAQTSASVVSIQATSGGNAYTLVLPSSHGSANQVLASTGSGSTTQLTWANTISTSPATSGQLLTANGAGGFGTALTLGTVAGIPNWTGTSFGTPYETCAVTACQSSSTGGGTIPLLSTNAVLYAAGVNISGGSLFSSNVNITGNLTVGSCTGCSSMVYPAAGVPVSTGTGWSTSLQTGTASGNIPLLGSGGSLTLAGGLNIQNGGVNTFQVASATGNVTLYGVLSALNTSATNGNAGDVMILPGASTSSTTQGNQGLYAQGYIYVRSTGTVTQWNLQCQVASMTVGDCLASPTSIIGIAEFLNPNTVQVISSGQIAVNASAAVTQGHTVCAGLTAGEVTDSGSSNPCPTSAGINVGTVIATAGTWTLPDGTQFIASTLKPLIQLASSSSGVPSDMMTTDTAQTVTAVKTFAANLLAGGSYNIGSTSQFWSNAYSVQFTGKTLQITSLVPFAYSYFLQQDSSNNLLLQSSNLTQNIMLKWTPGGSGGATMTAYGNVVPDATDTEGLGTSGDEWNTAYIHNLTVSGTCSGCGQTYTAGTGISIASNVIANTGVLSWNGSTGAITDGVTTDTTQTITADKTVNANILGGGGFSIGSTSQFWSNIYGNELYTKTLQVTSAVPFAYSYFMQQDSSNNLLLQSSNLTQNKMLSWTPGGSGGATMTVYGNVLPNATDTDNLGASGTEWNNIYAKNITVTGTCTGCGSGGSGGGVSSVTGTANQITATGTTAVTLSLPSQVNITNIMMGSNTTAGVQQTWCANSTTTCFQLIQTGSSGSTIPLSMDGRGDLSMGGALNVLATGQFGQTVTFSQAIATAPFGSNSGGMGQFQAIFFNGGQPYATYGIGIESYFLDFNAYGGYKFYQQGATAIMTIGGNGTSAVTIPGQLNVGVLDVASCIGCGAIPYPPAGIPVSTGTTWSSTSLQTGTASGNIPVLNSSSLLPASTVGLTTSGDLLYYNGTNLSRVPLVGNGFCLGNSGGSWAGLTCGGGGTSGVSSINGMTGAITFSGSNGLGVSAFSGAVTLSLPQNLASNGDPTFAGMVTTGTSLGAITIQGGGGITFYPSGSSTASLTLNGSNGQIIASNLSVSANAAFGGSTVVTGPVFIYSSGYSGGRAVCISSDGHLYYGSSGAGGC